MPGGAAPEAEAEAVVAVDTWKLMARALLRRHLPPPPTLLSLRRGKLPNTEEVVERTVAWSSDYSHLGEEPSVKKHSAEFL